MLSKLFKLVQQHLKTFVCSPWLVFGAVLLTYLSLKDVPTAPTTQKYDLSTCEALVQAYICSIALSVPLLSSCMSEYIILGEHSDFSDRFTLVLNITLPNIAAYILAVRAFDHFLVLLCIMEYVKLGAMLRVALLAGIARCPR